MSNKLTRDEHLHDKTPEHVYRVHHGLDPETGLPVRGNAEPAEDECFCAHCVAHVEQDPEILAAAKEAYAKGPKEAKSKASKRRK